MHPFNFVLSQFFVWSMLAGGILWSLLISLAQKMGLSGAMASGVAGAISILLIALFVFGRWARQKKHSSRTEPQTNWQYRIGYALVAFGNAIFLLLIAFLFLVSPKYDYVVGGMAVFLGGGDFINLVANWLASRSLLSNLLTPFFRVSQKSNKSPNPSFQRTVKSCAFAIR